MIYISLKINDKFVLQMFAAWNFDLGTYLTFRYRRFGRSIWLVSLQVASLL